MALVEGRHEVEEHEERVGARGHRGPVALGHGLLALHPAGVTAGEVRVDGSEAHEASPFPVPAAPATWSMKTR